MAAFNAIAINLGLEPSPMPNPDNWRRSPLHGRVFWKIAGLSPADRDDLKRRLSDAGLSAPGLAAAQELIEQVYPPEQLRDV